MSSLYIVLWSCSLHYQPVISPLHWYQTARLSYQWTLNVFVQINSKRQQTKLKHPVSKQTENNHAICLKLRETHVLCTNKPTRNKLGNLVRFSGLFRTNKPASNKFEQLSKIQRPVPCVSLDNCDLFSLIGNKHWCFAWFQKYSFGFSLCFDKCEIKQRI